jgi:iron complex transport system substrate-binding protein
MQKVMTAAQSSIQDHAPLRALFLAPNGMSYGSYTLRDDFIEAIGWENVATSLGLNGPGVLPLETLLAADPDVVILDTPRDRDVWLANPLLQHPALQKSYADKPMIILPDAWFQCAGPSLVNAWQSLALQLEALEAGE